MTEEPATQEPATQEPATQEPATHDPAVDEQVELDRPLPGRRTAAVAAGVLAVIVALLVAVLATRDPSTERATQSKLLGHLAPAVEGTTLDGRHVSVDDYRGRWVVVNFFASWCTPCITENPQLQAFDEAHRDAGDAVLIGVTFQDQTKDARDFFAKRGGTWPVIDDHDGSISVAFGIAKVPESWIIAPDGTVVERFAGAVTEQDLDEALRKLSGGSVGT